MPGPFISALGLVKLAAAISHKKARRLPPKLARAIIAAAEEVAAGKLAEQFVVDVFQTGSGTSTNMNVNEVIANRAAQLLGRRAIAGRIHPNDHVNMGQSSNDVIPTALHISAAVAIAQDLLPALQKLSVSLWSKAHSFDRIVKIGRTHLMDAVPIRLGQEFSGYAAQVDSACMALGGPILRLCELAIGGTAVGTALNAPKGFAREVCRFLARRTGLPFRETTNHFAAQAAADAAVAASGALRGVALSLGKIASDIRLLGSGPRCGLGELLLPATQPGSSIMPGKVNPVICESVIQVACQVVGCDAAIAAACTGGVGGILELHVAMPVVAWNLLTAIGLLANVARTFEAKCIRGLKANEARCRELVERSLAMVTVLAPRIGYDAAASLAKEASASGKTIRQVCLERRVLPPKKLDALLDAVGQTGPRLSDCEGTGPKRRG
jgi:fumarate hydratase class II